MSARTITARKSAATNRAQAVANAPVPTRHHGNRFGRSEEAREAVMEAVDDLLLECGFAALTIEAVAARAGVGKQTIYRWWSSKSDLLFDAFLDETREELDEIDAGDLRVDLVAHLRQVIAFFGRASNAAMFRALAGQAQLDPAVGRRFREQVVGQQRERDRMPFLKAHRCGEWPDLADAERVIDELTAPIFYRLLMVTGPLDGIDVEALVDRCLHDRR